MCMGTPSDTADGGESSNLNLSIGTMSALNEHIHTVIAKGDFETTKLDLDAEEAQ
ncbi:hypothetical protein TrRE_jg268, partial [Triparma retinervis]